MRVRVREVGGCACVCLEEGRQRELTLHEKELSPQLIEIGRHMSEFRSDTESDCQLLLALQSNFLYDLFFFFEKTGHDKNCLWDIPRRISCLFVIF